MCHESSKIRMHIQIIMYFLMGPLGKAHKGDWKLKRTQYSLLSSRRYPMNCPIEKVANFSGGT